MKPKAERLNGNYWSSTPNGSNAYNLNVNSSSANINNNNTSNTNGVRCVSQ